MRQPVLPRVIITAIGVLAAASGLLLTQTANASHDDRGTLRVLSVYEDQFLNWDFSNRGESVDWPINILFWNNAEVDKIKLHYRLLAGWSGSWCGSTKWARLNDGSGWTWDGDSGVKTPCAPTCYVSSTHMRLYAPSGNDRMYNRGWGYYVLASTHRDRNEFCFFGRQYGWSEDAEASAVDTARRFGWSVGHDWASFYNYLPGTYSGNHYLQNDGRASQVRVP